MQLAPERQQGKEPATQQRSKSPELKNLQLKRALNGIEGFEAQSAALLPPSPGPGEAVQLKTATSGPDLAAVQEKLNQLGYPCGKADGIMGPKTKSAIMSFQSDHGLTADGICGDGTLAALDSAKSGDGPKTKEPGAGGGGAAGPGAAGPAGPAPAAPPAGAKSGGGGGDPKEVTPEPPKKDEAPGPEPVGGGAGKEAAGGGGAPAGGGAASAAAPASDAGEELRKAVLAQGQGAVGKEFMKQEEIDAIRAKSGLGTYTTCVDFAGKMYRETIGAVYKGNQDAMMKMATQMGDFMKMFMERQTIVGTIAQVKKSLPNFDKAIDAFKQKIADTNQGIANLEANADLPDKAKAAQVAAQQKILGIYERELKKAEDRKEAFVAKYIAKPEDKLAKLEQAMAGKIVIAQPGFPARPRLGEFLLQVSAAGGTYTVGSGASVSLGAGSFKHICILESMSPADKDGVEEWVTIDGGGTHGERRVRYIRTKDCLMFNTREQAADANTPPKNAIGGWLDSSGLAAAVAG